MFRLSLLKPPTPPPFPPPAARMLSPLRVDCCLEWCEDGPLEGGSFVRLFFGLV